MNDIKQIKEMARTIFESCVAIDGIDLAFAAVHGADMEDSHFMRIAKHLYHNGYRKTFTSELESDAQKASKEGYDIARFEIAERREGMMEEPNKEITLDEAIAHFEAIEKCARMSGLPETTHGQVARYLRRLKRYEDAIEKGELVWREEMPKKRKTTKKEKTNGN